jgi:hypothetical protein
VPVADGKYIVQQNEWNSHKRQCIGVTGTSWRITAASFRNRTNGPPASFPSIFTGCHWGLCSTSGRLPLRVGRLSSVRSSWSTKQVSSGAYNVAFDLWTNSQPTTSGQPNGSEIMIWLSSRGEAQPAGSKVARVRIAGASWEVWRMRMSDWSYIAYRRVRGVRSVTNLNLLSFIKDSVRRGSTSRKWYLIAAEAGFEIWKGGEGLGTRSFSVTAS